ncbi:MAG: nitronate monooxygenase [Rickettsiales bacterium]|nr:nitronate monooxygenase [Rickettsiales bacterium]
MLKNLEKIIINNKEFLPVLEGGKGIGISTGITAGHFARKGCIGTFSGVNPDFISSGGEIVKLFIKAKTRMERHLEMVQNSIKNIISHAKIARDIAGNKGRIHMNVLWEMGGTEFILDEVLTKAKNLIQGIVCGAGLPYRLGDICAKHKINYFPIVSSMRAFRVLWKKSYERTKEWLGGVVYECPWRAGGHNGLSNNEDPLSMGNTYERVCELRKFMNEVDLQDTPIIIAGGVWNIKEYEDFLNNESIGKVAFQFGTRPMLTQESPISDEWKQELLNLKSGDIKANKFSPTGFYSLAVNNNYLTELFERSRRQVGYSAVKNDIFSEEIIDVDGAKFYIRGQDLDGVGKWMRDGFNKSSKTPDNTVIFLTREKFDELRNDVAQCYGCLSQCQFSCWTQCKESKNNNTGNVPDFRKMCIQKALQNAKNNEEDGKQLHFAGSDAYKFATDPLYRGGYIPTISELVDNILEGR